FFSDLCSTYISALSLHDALPILVAAAAELLIGFEVKQYIQPGLPWVRTDARAISRALQNLISNAVKYSGESHVLIIRAVYQPERSEEHTSELQSLRHLVCRLLLE